MSKLKKAIESLTNLSKTFENLSDQRMNFKVYYSKDHHQFVLDIEDVIILAPNPIIRTKMIGKLGSGEMHPIAWLEGKCSHLIISKKGEIILE